ncbi:hypothetical protein M6D81_13870 [Paenibacillus sp. J5C_2022]|uniref:hypothetical protein n=1 Tax=Paenibacillus sp. J5C2022 TaxID=2977129 RepID=UPI0021D31E3D|nr:hypothetical protein [Paenibacillus sp. J5C2022]MCU6709780.1 hypothetical protein [Paenibacillus sp. J5C2022]
MQIICYDSGQVTITNDEAVTSRSTGTVDVEHIRVDADILARLYEQAGKTKTIEDANIYVSYKARILAVFNG